MIPVAHFTPEGTIVWKCSECSRPLRRRQIPEKVSALLLKACPQCGQVAEWAKAEIEEIQPLNCSKCGRWLVNINALGMPYGSSHYNGTDICDSCMMEHCLNTECSQCSLYAESDCRFRADKEFAEEVLKNYG